MEPTVDTAPSKKWGVLFSSKTDQHATPRDLAAHLVKIYNIRLDACADATNAVVPRFYTKEVDSLTQQWSGEVFCNPPYSRKLHLWIDKGIEAHKSGATIVWLLPSRTDTQWFKKAFEASQEVYFINGRLKFGHSKDAAPFPSVIMVMGGSVGEERLMRCCRWQEIG